MAPVVRLDDLPKTFRPVVLVILAIVTVVGATLGAYGGGVAKAESIAASVAASKDQVIIADLETHKGKTEARFDGVAEQLRLIREEQRRTNERLDRLLERRSAGGGEVP